MFDAASDNQRPLAAINLTPIIGVLAALLALFLLAAPATNKIADRFAWGEMPPPPGSNLTEIDIALDADGRLFWNGNPLDRRQLQTQLDFIAHTRERVYFDVRSARQAKYSDLTSVLAMLQTYDMPFGLGSR